MTVSLIRMLLNEILFAELECSLKQMIYKTKNIYIYKKKKIKRPLKHVSFEKWLVSNEVDFLDWIEL